MNDDPAKTLLERLARELYQTEAAAMTQAAREAERIGTEAPATAMTDVGHHADQVVKLLPDLFKTRGIERLTSRLGAAASFAFSMLRRFGMHLILGPERSYRFTLAGMRYGIDLVYELEHLAMELKDEELTEFCRTWLERRVPQVTEVERQLQWFVHHPDRALQGA